jgi:hypothetical protein
MEWKGCRGANRCMSMNKNFMEVKIMEVKDELKNLKEVIQWYQRGVVEDLDDLKMQEYDWELNVLNNAEKRGWVKIREDRFRHPYITKKAADMMLKLGVISKRLYSKWLEYGVILEE